MNQNLQTTQSNYVTLESGDPLFCFNDGFTLVPRASIAIDKTCPQQYTEIIAQAVQRGWVKPIAHMPGKEATWTRLKE